LEEFKVPKEFEIIEDPKNLPQPDDDEVQEELERIILHNE